MVQLKHSDMRTIEKAFQADAGYVLNFSDRTFREFFEDEFKIDIDQDIYRANGSSKVNRLRTFFKSEEASIVARVMRKLWDYRQTVPRFDDDDTARVPLFDLIVSIEAGENSVRTDAIDRFVPDPTLEEIVAGIERDISAASPAAALDRLHTYCMKKFAHLLDKRAIGWDRSEPLQSRVGKYVKALRADRPLQEMTEQILKNAIGVFDKFNFVRNNKSIAHDNEILSSTEARFIFESVSALLRFVKAEDTARFGS